MGGNGTAGSMRILPTKRLANGLIGEGPVVRNAALWIILLATVLGCNKAAPPDTKTPEKMSYAEALALYRAGLDEYQRISRLTRKGDVELENSQRILAGLEQRRDRYRPLAQGIDQKTRTGAAAFGALDTGTQQYMLDIARRIRANQPVALEEESQLLNHVRGTPLEEQILARRSARGMAGYQELAGRDALKEDWKDELAKAEKAIEDAKKAHPAREEEFKRSSAASTKRLAAQQQRVMNAWVKKWLADSDNQGRQPSKEEAEQAAADIRDAGGE